MHYSSNVKKKNIIILCYIYTGQNIFYFLILFHFCTLLLSPHSSLLYSSCLALRFFLFLRLASLTRPMLTLSIFLLPFIFFSFLPPLNHSKSFLSQTSLSKLNHNLKTNQIKTIKKKKKDHKFDPSESESEREKERES